MASGAGGGNAQPRVIAGFSPPQQGAHQSVGRRVRKSTEAGIPTHICVPNCVSEVTRALIVLRAWLRHGDASTHLVHRCGLYFFTSS
jgi:hypothetical protein